MNYITFTFKDPDTLLLKCVGVKYKETEFTSQDILKFSKNGTSNKDVKDYLKKLREENKLPEINIIYNGTSSVEACYAKQQILIGAVAEGLELIGHQPLVKQYTKKVRSNSNMRRPITDQYGTSYSGVLEAAERLLLAPSNISKVLHGKLEHIGGYQFRFV